jgi:hypothetical protein
MKLHYLSRYIKPIALVAFLALVIFVGVWGTRQRQDIRKEASENGVNLLVAPQTNGGEVITTNTQFTREIVITNPSQVQIANYEITLSFPPSLVEVVSMDSSMSPVPTEVFSTFDNASGTIRLSRVDIGQTPTTLATFTVGRIIFRAKTNTGTANVNFTQQLVSGAPTGSTIVIQLPVDSVQNGTYTLSDAITPTTPPTIPVSSPTPTTFPGTITPTSTTTPSPTAIITTMPTTVFLNTTEFSFQGRGYGGASKNLPAVVSIKDTNNQWNTNIVNGIISNLPLTNTTEGQLTVILRPEGYMAREITHTFATGQNTLSLAGIIFCGGDIDGNAVVNSFDYSELLREYGDTGGRADLDGSGQVNSLDFSLLLSNFFETPATQECTL